MTRQKLAFENWKYLHGLKKKKSELYKATLHQKYFSGQVLIFNEYQYSCFFLVHDSKM